MPCLEWKRPSYLFLTGNGEKEDETNVSIARKFNLHLSKKKPISSANRDKLIQAENKTQQNVFRKPIFKEDLVLVSSLAFDRGLPAFILWLRSGSLFPCHSLIKFCYFKSKEKFRNYHPMFKKKILRAGFGLLLVGVDRDSVVSIGFSFTSVFLF